MKHLSKGKSSAAQENSGLVTLTELWSVMGELGLTGRGGGGSLSVVQLEKCVQNLTVTVQPKGADKRTGGIGGGEAGREKKMTVQVRKIGSPCSTW